MHHAVERKPDHEPSARDHVDDDCFNLDQARVHDFCERVGKKNLRTGFVFPNGLRTDLLNREELQALRKAGTEMIAVAVETVSPRLQKLIGKNLDLERVAEAIKECRRLGIATLGFFMFGFPTETLIISLPIGT